MANKKSVITSFAIALVVVFGGPTANAIGAGISNGDFESSTVGDTVISGWTAMNQRIDLGVDTIAGCLTVDTSDYTTLEDFSTTRANKLLEWTNAYAASQSNPNPANFPINSDPTVSNDSVDLGQLDNPSVFGTSVIDSNAEANFVWRQNALKLTSSINTVLVPGYVVHGPAVYSEVFSATTLDDLTFDWAASNASDNHHVFGYLLNVDTCAQTELIDSTGRLKSWTTVATAVPSSGNYRFVFVSGTFDKNFGTAAGAILYVDNVLLTVNQQRQAAAVAAAATPTTPAASTLARTGESSLESLGIASIALVFIGLTFIAIYRSRSIDTSASGYDKEISN